MQGNYYITGDKGEIDLATVTARLARMADLVPRDSEKASDKERGRSVATHVLDKVLSFIRKRVRPLHWTGLAVTAVIFYIYARLVAFTARLITSGETGWPNVPAPSVVALWHAGAPSLLVAFAMRKTKARAAILVAGDPRGDYLALLCRMMGFDVVRTSGVHGGWRALTELAEKLKQGACVIITADGDGPARTAKFGATALASATGVPLVPLSADCHPALQQSHKWDAARNPLPFSSISVWIGAPRAFEPFLDRESIESARKWLEETLNRRS